MNICKKNQINTGKIDTALNSLSIPLKKRLEDVVFIYPFETSNKKTRLKSSPSEEVIRKLVTCPKLTTGEGNVFITMGSKSVIRDEYLLRNRINAAVKEREEILTKEIEEAVIKAVEETKQEEQDKYDPWLTNKIMQLEEEYEVKINEAEDVETFKKVKEKYAFIELLKQTLNEERQIGINILREYLKHQFEYLIEWERHQLFFEYQQKLKDHIQKSVDAFKTEKEILEKKMKEICQNIKTANDAMFFKAISDEREANKDLAERISLAHSSMIKGRRDDKIADKEMQTLRKRNLKLKHELESWNSLGKGIVKEFQKLINYVLNERPHQGDFLISYFKLKDSVCSTAEKNEKDSDKVIEDQPQRVLIDTPSTGSVDIYSLLSEEQSRKDKISSKKSLIEPKKSSRKKMGICLTEAVIVEVVLFVYPLREAKEENWEERLSPRVEVKASLEAKDSSSRSVCGTQELEHPKKNGTAKVNLTDPKQEEGIYFSEETEMRLKSIKQLFKDQPSLMDYFVNR